MLIVLSGFVLYLLAIGYGCRPWQAVTNDPIERAALSLGLGILVNFCIVLAGLPFRFVFSAGAVLVLAGVRSGYLAWRSRSRDGFGIRWGTVMALGVVGATVAIYYFRVLSDPIEAWDARSVWFFHAKIMWLAGGLSRAGWDHPSIEFSSPDYPKLVGSIAAQLGYLRGFWNEFFPKASLLVVLLPALLWIFSFRKRTVSFLLIVLPFFFAYNEWLSNGYMDGYLLIYSAISLLCVGRFLADGREADLQSAFCALGIVCVLKNEGLLFGACVAAAVLMTIPFTAARPLALLTAVRDRPQRVVVPLLAMAPAATWSLYKLAWGLQNAITREPAGAWTRLLGRVHKGDVSYILEFLLVRANGLWVPAALVAASVAFMSVRRARLHPGILVAALTAVFHFSGMFVVYLSTPAELTFHLTTSAFRTMASTRAALLVALYFCLSDLEAGRSPSRSSDARGASGLEPEPSEAAVLS